MSENKIPTSIEEVIASDYQGLLEDGPLKDKIPTSIEEVIASDYQGLLEDGPLKDGK